MSLTDRLDAFQRRHPVVGYPIGVAYKFFDDQGAYLAALITYYGFLSIFPLLLLLTSVLGFLTQNNPGLRADVINSALSQLPVIGKELATPSGLQGSLAAVVFGSLTALYGGLGIAQAIQHTSNTCWGVPRNKRPNPILARLRSAAVLLFLGVALIGVGWLPRQWPALGQTPGQLLNIVLGTGLFLILMKMTTAREQGWGRQVPGALLMSVVWQVLNRYGPTLYTSWVSRSSDTYGTFTSVIVLLLAAYVLSVAFVIGTEVNVVLRRHLYPRSLLTPFTDAVDLTHADHQAYTQLAQMQQLKGYEYIDVLFDKNGDGIADSPSDLHQRWDHVQQANERWATRGHPVRPPSMWGESAEATVPMQTEGDKPDDRRNDRDEWNDSGDHVGGATRAGAHAPARQPDDGDDLGGGRPGR